MKPITTVFLIFLLLSFASGIYFCATHQMPIRKEGFDSNKDLSGPTEMNCPDMLIKSGNTLLLFNSKLPQSPGVNPLPFYNLDEYINYLEIQRKKGIHCPVLFVQQENNTQGQTVFRVRPDVFETQGGLPTQSYSDNPVKITDASREHGPWNANQYSGFDPTGQYVGQYTTLDALHDSTYKAQNLSENPMDTNWGGVLYTKQAVDSGKYKENEVEPPHVNIFQEKGDNIHDEKKNQQTSIFA
jgi:hypothetical protein